MKHNKLQIITATIDLFLMENQSWFLWVDVFNLTDITLN